MRVRVCLRTPPVRIVALRLAIRRHIKNTLADLVAATGRPELAFFLEFKTSAGTSDVVGYCDCRHVSDDVKSHHKTLMKVTMSMNTTMTTGQHRVLKIVWCCSSFSTVQCVCIQCLLRSLRCRCLLVGWVLYGLCTGLCSNARSSGVATKFFLSNAILSNSSMLDCFLVHAHSMLLVLEVALRDCSVIVFFRNPKMLLLS